MTIGINLQPNYTKVAQLVSPLRCSSIDELCWIGIWCCAEKRDQFNFTRCRLLRRFRSLHSRATAKLRRNSNGARILQSHQWNKPRSNLRTDIRDKLITLWWMQRAYLVQKTRSNEGFVEPLVRNSYRGCVIGQSSWRNRSNSPTGFSCWRAFVRRCRQFRWIFDWNSRSFSQIFIQMLIVQGKHLCLRVQNEKTTL